MERYLLLLYPGVTSLLIFVAPPLCSFLLALQASTRNDFGSGGLAIGICVLGTLLVSTVAEYISYVLVRKFKVV